MHDVQTFRMSPIISLANCTEFQNSTFFKKIIANKTIDFKDTTIKTVLLLFLTIVLFFTLPKKFIQVQNKFLEHVFKRKTVNAQQIDHIENQSEQSESYLQQDNATSSIE